MNNTLEKQSLDRGMIVVVSLVALTGIGGMAAWLTMGDKLFWSLIQSGLAWCL